MSKSARVRLRDLQALHDLAGECRDFGDDPVAWREHFAARLGGLAGAAVVSIFELKPGRAGWSRFAHWGWDASGLDQSAWDRLVEAAAREGPQINPMAVGYLAALAAEDGIALTRGDLVRDAEFYRSRYYREYHRETGADAQMNCFRSIPGGDSGVVLVRPAGESDFGSRHRVLVRHAHALVAPMIGRALARFDEPSPAALPPRVRQVLLCLLEGDGDKQIAARLKLSAHTVNEYVKRVFAHFGVASRTELLARWVRRGWGASGPAWADRL